MDPIRDVLTEVLLSTCRGHGAGSEHGPGLGRRGHLAGRPGGISGWTSSWTGSPPGRSLPSASPKQVTTRCSSTRSPAQCTPVMDAMTTPERRSSLPWPRPGPSSASSATRETGNRPGWPGRFPEVESISAAANSSASTGMPSLVCTPSAAESAHSTVVLWLLGPAEDYFGGRG